MGIAFLAYRSLVLVFRNRHGPRCCPCRSHREKLAISAHEPDNFFLECAEAALAITTS